uniref:Abraxas 1, BRCA1 A complex subunit n=1 Tax=Xiphophorus couchianus TaxID=32473 RepID=A0A3B5MQB0_9TELE
GIMSEPSVRISGTVLASLMFQHVNSDSDVVRKSFRTFTVVLSESLFVVQDSVIGWYRQRRHSEQHMTFREKLVHDKLKSVLKNPHMIFLLLTSSRVTPTDSTHLLSSSLYRRFVNIPVLVTNLGLLEQQGYWKLGSCSQSSAVRSRSRFFSPSGLLKEVDEMNKMNDSLQVELQKACREVEESERAVEALQLEVSALRKSLREKQQSSAGKVAETSSPVEPRNNQLLLKAVRALLGSCPLLLSQRLSLQAFPVPSRDTMAADSDREQEQPALQQDDHGTKQRGGRGGGRGAGSTKCLLSRRSSSTMAEHGAVEVPRGSVGWMCIYSTSYSMETRQKQVKDLFCMHNSHIGDLLVKSCRFLRHLYFSSCLLVAVLQRQ